MAVPVPGTFCKHPARSTHLDRSQRINSTYYRFYVFSNNCDTVNADVAFSPNVISNVKYMYNDWLSIILMNRSWQKSI